MKYENLISLISSSHLSQEEKADLIALLNSDRIEDFFNMFYTYVTYDVEKRTQALQFMSDTYDTLSRSLEEEMKKEKEDVYVKLEDNLKDADSSSRDLIWNEYYARIEEINSEYKDRLKNILPTISREYIKR